MNWTLEVVVVPVSDLDRAKAFYADKLGFTVDHDTHISDTMRVMQFTPRGSGCSVVIGKGIAAMQPGSLQGLQLVVNDIRAAHAYLTANGVECTPVVIMGPEGQRPAVEGDDLNNAGFIFFNDPDGNGWAVQQITARP